MSIPPVRDLSLRTKLLASFVLVIAIIAFAGAGSAYLVALNEMERLNTELLLQDIAATGSLLESEFAIYLRKADVLFNNRGIQAALVRDYSEATLSEILQTYQQELYDRTTPLVDDLMDTTTLSRDSVGAVGLWLVRLVIHARNTTLPSDGRLITAYDDIAAEEWAAGTIAARGQAYWRGPFEDGANRFVSVNRALRDFSSMEEIGILSILVPQSRLSHLLSLDERRTSARLYLIDRSGAVVSARRSAHDPDRDLLDSFASDPAETGREVTTIVHEGEAYLATVLRLDTVPWRLVGLLPYRVVQSRVERVRLVIVLLISVATVLAVVAALVLARLTTQRIALVTDKMRRLRQNRRLDLARVEGDDEIGQLDDELNRMVHTINVLADRERDLEHRQLSLEVELLQSQINPHMLYNTLSALAWDAHKIGAHEMETAVERLIRFFRLYLNGGSIVTTLGAEAEMARHYIEVYVYTHKMDVDYRIDMDPELHDVPMLNLVLQPLVENALVHGLRPWGDSGTLTIMGSREPDGVYVVVADDGAGMESDVLTKIRAGERASRTGGFGLHNVCRRLELYFGRRAALDIESAPRAGTRVTVRLPLIDGDVLRGRLERPMPLHNPVEDIR